MSTEIASKIPTHQPSKRSRAPPPPTQKQSVEENKNGSLSEQDKNAVKNNGNIEEAGSIGTSNEGEERLLTVVLPGDKVVKASVKKDTPILELLIMIASKNKLNPTNHMIAQPAARAKDPPVQLKPTQKLSDVVGDTVHIIRKNQKQHFVYKKDEKKSAVYEPTTRITVISGKSHKICLRVAPEKTLQELFPIICDERGVEPSNHTLRLTTRPEDPLDMSQTLEKSGVIEFLLIDLKGQSAYAGIEGGEVDLMPEQKKKKGSLFARISKKKKGYEFGGGGITEAPPTNVSPNEMEQRSRRHTSPSFPPSDVPSHASTVQEDESNTLKKRRPAPPPPPGKHLTGASDDEKLDEELSTNTLKKRRAPPPPRPTSPPRRTMSLGAGSADHVASIPPPRPVSPPMRANVDGETRHVADTQEMSPSAQEMENNEENDTESPRQDLADIDAEVHVAGLSLERKVDQAEERVEPKVPKGEVKTEKEPLKEGVDSQKDEAFTEDDEEKDKDTKAKKELLSHMMKMSLDEDTKETNAYPPHTQADDTHNILEEKSVHALAFEVTREASIDSREKTRQIGEGQEKETEDGKKMEDNLETDEDEKKQSLAAGLAEMTIEKEKEEPIKVDESLNEFEDRRESHKVGPSGVTIEKLNKQYALLQEQLASMQKQMSMPQQPVMMEIQMQQLQQQIMLQQQMISQMMMSNQQPMVMPLAYQQPVMSPQQHMMLTPQQMISPPQQMISPPQQMISPPQQMISPQMMSSQQMMPQQMLSPQQQMIMSPQQLMMTPPMMYSRIPGPQSAVQPNKNSQEVTSTATVQAQQTPISSTHEANDAAESPTKNDDLPTEEDGSQAENDDLPTEEDGLQAKNDDMPTEKDGSQAENDDRPTEGDDSPTGDGDVSINDDMIHLETNSSTVDVEPELRPLSPPVKADEIPVGHPTYHFVQSQDVPNKEIKAIHTSPPNTLRSPKQQQRPHLLDAEKKPSERSLGSDEKVETEAESQYALSIDTDKCPTPEGVDTEDKVDANKNPTPDGNHAEDKLDANKNPALAVGHTEDKPNVSKTENKSIADETSYISAFAVSDSKSIEPVSSSAASKSPKQKKGFSLFKKKTPKYSYILSAQKEFSRKSETERQRTSSNPAQPTNVKSKSGKGNRGRAHTLDSYDPNKASDVVIFDPARVDFEQEMAKNFHIPPNVMISATEISDNSSSERPVIPPRSSKPKSTGAKTSVPKSSQHVPTTQSSSLSQEALSTVSMVTNTSASTNKIPVPPTVSPAFEISSTKKPFPTLVSSPSQGASTPTKPKSQPSPNKTIPPNPPQETFKIPSKTHELVSPGVIVENPLPPVRKVHTKPNDAYETEAIGSRARPVTEGAPQPRRRAQIHNIRSEEQEQAKVKADASVSQLRQIFGPGNQ